MGFFKRRRKNKRTIEEQNRHNEETWKTHTIKREHIPEEMEDWKKYQKEMLELYKKAGVDEEYVENFLLSDEGKNVMDDGTIFWVCSHCTGIVKFNSKEDYVSHHFRVHT